MDTFIITNDDLLIDDLAHILNSNFKIQLDDSVRQKIIKCRKFLDNKLSSSSNIYYRNQYWFWISLQ